MPLQGTSTPSNRGWKKHLLGALGERLWVPKSRFCIENAIFWEGFTAKWLGPGPWWRCGSLGEPWGLWAPLGEPLEGPGGPYGALGRCGAALKGCIRWCQVYF